MKKSLIVILLSVLAVSVFAQDSTSVALVKNGISIAEGRWSFVATIMTVLAIVSEILSLVPEKYIPANGVVDFIVKWIKALAKK